MTTLLIIAAVWLLIGSIFLISWIKFHRGLKSQEQIMDEPINMDFKSIDIFKSKSFDHHILVRKKAGQGALCVFGETSDITETVKGLSIIETAEITYVHQNFNKIWKQLLK